MSTAIKLKKSSVVGKRPLVGDLAYGELAINYEDGRLFYKNSSNEIKYFIDSDRIGILIDSATSGTFLPLTGGTLSGAVDMQSNRIINLSSPIDVNDAVNKYYVDNAIISGVGAVEFPAGNYGTVDSASQIDAFGIATGGIYDTVTPIGSLATVDLGVDSSV
jgi:hypothetical protein